MKYLLACFIVFCSPLLHAVPPEDVPVDLWDQFTLNGKIPVKYWYRDDSRPEGESIYQSKAAVDSYMERVARGECYYYGETDTCLYAAFEKYPIRGKSVAIIGSILPWYEAIVLFYGGNPVTIEYNKIHSDDPRRTIMTVDEYNANPLKFDVVLSVSSTEHDGLGRYGDPINPNGDIEFMSMVKEKMLKEEGMMFFSVPIGQDCLFWNVHRIYGPLRLPMLLQEWDMVDSFGFTPDAFDLELGYDRNQPVLCLKPK